MDRRQYQRELEEEGVDLIVGVTEEDSNWIKVAARNRRRSAAEQGRSAGRRQFTPPASTTDPE